MKRQPRATSNLSESIRQQLKMYALAASAAGMGALALAPVANARIVYTPAHLKIVTNRAEIFIDLNHDGVNDFGFSARSAHATSSFSANLAVERAQQGNAVWSVEDSGHKCAAALAEGARIGPKRPFDVYKLVMAFSGSHAGSSDGYCPWRVLSKPAYLGLKFFIKGKTHFGWARFEDSTGFGTTLTGYAYETVPGKPIIAGRTKGPEETDIGQPHAAVLAGPAREPASLGLLAQGTTGLVAWRRRDSQEEQMKARERSIP